MALAYWLAATLSLKLALVHGQVTPVWPPTGIALVALLVMGLRVWPAITVAALAVNLPIGPSPLGAAAIAAGNTLAPVVSALLLRRTGFRLEMERLRDAVAIIVLAALAGMTISATVGSSVLALSGAISGKAFWPTWAVWWAGDAMGVLLVAPFLLSVVRRPPLPPISWRRGAELTALLAGTAVVTYVLFTNRLRLEYLVLPLIMATAWRFRLRGAAPAALIASGVAIWAAVEGVGPFATEDLFQKMITLQVFNVSVAAASFLLASFVDTRERQEELTRLYVSSQLANDAKSSFLNMVAHELRTPLSVLGGYLSMLSDGSLGAVPRGWESPLRILMAKTRELNGLVDDLLEASRIESGAARPVRSQIDLREVVNDAVERARPRADLLGAEIGASLTSDGLRVEADPAEVGRILDNLINNGLTYTARPPRLSVSLAGDSDRALVRVADNGVGIREDELDRVFDRFHRSSDPAFADVRGTGLGLYISRQLAQRYRGDLIVESSKPGDGTVFTLALPLSRAVPASD